MLRRLCTSKISTRGSKSQVRSPHDTPRGLQLIEPFTVLKASLRGLFKSYGEVLDVVAHKNLRMRGQAFVSFASTDIAKKAAKEVRGFPLYSKPMVRRPSDRPFRLTKASTKANIVCEISVRHCRAEVGSFGIGYSQGEAATTQECVFRF